MSTLKKWYTRREVKALCKDFEVPYSEFTAVHGDWNEYKAEDVRGFFALPAEGSSDHTND